MEAIQSRGGRARGAGGVYRLGVRTKKTCRLGVRTRRTCRLSVITRGTCRLGVITRRTFKLRDRKHKCFLIYPKDICVLII